jgi:NAD(P)-dependent dehydrogenase (short-subunit alcohol dehydrogenase family)
MAWTTEQIPRLTGTTAIVTGANSGIGYFTALALARAGADVVIGCRDPARGDAAARDLQSASGGRVTQLPLDLADLSSVRTFVDRFLSDHPRLDLLVNNAGVMALPRRETTVDGFERQFGTNHLGHFALTGLLWPALRRSPAARVVTVSSLMAWSARLDLDDLQSERRYRPMDAYSRTKLANLHFMLGLARRAEATDIRSIAAHPGMAATNLQRHAFDRLVRIIGQSAAAGALPSLYAATAPDARAGGFYGPRWFGAFGAPTTAWIPGHARDERIAARLWDQSEQLTGVRFPAGAA